MGEMRSRISKQVRGEVLWGVIEGILYGPILSHRDGVRCYPEGHRIALRVQFAVAGPVKIGEGMGDGNHMTLRLIKDGVTHAV
jgi:hypothetical protein